MTSSPQPERQSASPGGLGSSFVIVEPGEIARLTLNRPNAQNAVNPALVHQLKQTVQTLLDDPNVHGIVIRGAGKSFCVGADLGFFQRHVASGELEPIHKFSAACHELHTLVSMAPKPIVACVHGAVLGA